MPRIRSIHPGQWTDEEFVSCSPIARLLALALRNEADDNGVFEWKPVSIKMRLFPADNIDIEAVLEELVTFNQVMKYDAKGRQLGAIRNFCRYQRPKKRKPVHLITPEVGTYVALSASSGELDDDEEAPVPKKARFSPQRKEEGGRISPKEISDRSNSVLCLDPRARASGEAA